MSRLHLSAFASLFLWLILLLAHSWHGPDIWYHLTWGREIVELGHWLPETPVLLKQPIPANGYWLFQAGLYLAYGLGGVYLVSFLFAALWIVTAVVWLRITGFWRKPVGLLLFTAFVAAMQTRFEHRPEVVSYTLMSLMIWFALSGRLWPLFAAQIVWANCHGFFVMGPFLAAAVWRHGGRPWRECAGLFAGLALATLVNPFGYRIYETVWLYSRFGGELKDLNHELFMPPIFPLYWPTTVFWLFWLATLTAVLYSLWHRRHLIPAALALGGLVLSAQMMRNVPLLFLLSPLLWRELALDGAKGRWRTAGTVAALTAGLALSLSVALGYYHGWVGSLARFGVRLESASYPLTAAEFLKGGGFRGKLFCDSYDGGYLEFHLDGVQIAGDSYFTDAAVTRRFFAAIKEPAALTALHAEFAFDAFLINIENTDIMHMLLGTQEWVAAFADSHRAVFVKRFENPGLSGDLAGFTYYRGEDLRHWTYEFGLVSWMALGYKRQMPGLMKKILSDLAAAPAIPSMLFTIGLKYASEHKDEEMVRLLAPLKDRVF